MCFDRRDIAMNKFVASGMEGQHHAFEARTQHPSEVRTPASPDKHCSQLLQTLLFLGLGTVVLSRLCLMHALSMLA